MKIPSCLLFLDKLLPKVEVDSWISHSVLCLFNRPCCFSFSLLQDLFMIWLPVNVGADENLGWCIFWSCVLNSSISTLGSGTKETSAVGLWGAGSWDLGIYYLIHASHFTLHLLPLKHCRSVSQDVPVDTKLVAVLRCVFPYRVEIQYKFINAISTFIKLT